MFNRRMTLLAAVALFALPAVQAQAWPERPIKLIVPFAAGGGTDIVARLLGRELSQSLGQPVIVENRVGAGGVIGTDAVAKAAPDGYTIGIIATGHTINPSVNPKLPYDSVADFRPVTPVVRLTSFIVVSNNFPAQNVKDMLDYAKANPGKLTFGSGGNGTGQHLFPELLASRTGVKLQHVPYKGGAPALADVVAGHIDMMFATIVETQSFVNAGKLKAIAVTGLRRNEAYPDVPTISEAGVAGVAGFDGDTWFGLVLPAKTPDAIVNRFNTEAKKALAQPDVQRQLKQQAAQPFTTTPEEFERLLKDQIETWRKVVQSMPKG